MYVCTYVYVMYVMYVGSVDVYEGVYVSVYVCMCMKYPVLISTHTYIHIHTYIHTYIHIHPCIHIHPYTYTYTYIHTNMHSHLYASLQKILNIASTLYEPLLNRKRYTHTLSSTHTHILIYTYTYTCIYITSELSLK